MFMLKDTCVAIFGLQRLKACSVKEPPFVPLTGSCTLYRHHLFDTYWSNNKTSYSNNQMSVTVINGMSYTVIIY